MPLRSLILLDIVHQHFQPAADAAVIEIESEPPYLDRLPAAFMLARVDARVEHMENLVVAREQRLIENLAVAPVERRLDRRRRDHDALVEHRNRGRVFLVLRKADREGGDQDQQAHWERATNFIVIYIYALARNGLP